MSTPVVTLVPETSPAIESTGVLSAETKASWNKGERSIVKPKEAPAPSKEVKEPSASESDETSAAPEAAPKQEQRRDNAASRLQELLADLKKAGLSPAELKTFKRQAEASAKSDVRPEPSPAAQPKVETVPKPTLEDKNTDGTPKFKTFGEYEDARDKWNREEAIREFRQTSERERREAVQREQEQKVTQTWQERVDAFKKAEPEFAGILDPKHPVHQPIQAAKDQNGNGPGAIVETFVLDSEQGPQVLHYLAEHQDELKSILGMPPVKLARELFKIEAQLTSPSKEEKTPVPPVTRAPKPVAEVGGRGTAPTDSLEAAAKASPGKLTPEFKAEANRRYLERGK